MPAGVTSESIATRRSGPEPRRMGSLTLLRLAKGRTRWTLDGRTYEISENQVFVILPGQVFSGVESSHGVPILVERVALDFGAARRLTAADLTRQLPITKESATLVTQTLLGAASPVVRLDRESGKLFGEVERFSGSDAPLAFAHRQACALHLLTRVCLAIAGDGGAGSSGGVSEAELRVARFLRELESQCDDNWTLDAMAARAGLKRSRFGEICRRLTGESPSTFLNRLRIRRSRRLLRDTDLTVTEIAFECGFQSSQYFAKLFRRYQGHEPSHYRKLAREVDRVGGIHYVKGDSARIMAYSEQEVELDSFQVEGEIALDRLGGTAASLEFGRNRFGFDGREGRFFVEGESFNQAQFFLRSSDIIREGIPFQFVLRRAGHRLSVTIDETEVANLSLDRALPAGPGKVGLRPLRNGIRVIRFSLNGRAIALRGDGR